MNEPTERDRAALNAYVQEQRRGSMTLSERIAAKSEQLTQQQIRGAKLAVGLDPKDLRVKIELLDILAEIVAEHEAESGR